MSMIPSDRQNLFGLNPEKLADIFQKIGQPRYRGRQVARWIYRVRTTDFGPMTNLPVSLRDRLQGEFKISRPTLNRVVRSADGTRKMVFELEGGTIESVLMFDADRRTICVSSQIGCPLDCNFCATGRMGFTRNLTVGEIVGQVLAVNDLLAPEKEVTNIVFMGMGEPLLNYDNLAQAIEILCSGLGPEISQKKMTVSTVGLVPQIKRLAGSGLKIGLAISLFSADEGTRKKLMPIAKKYPLTKVKKAALDFTTKTGRRLTFEIVLVKDVNDSPAQAKKLVSFIHGIPCKINLIRFHAYPGSGFTKPDEDRVLAFRDYLYPRAPAVTIRKSFGEDIAAACGQLAGRLDGAPDSDLISK